MNFGINLVAFLLMITVCHCGKSYGNDGGYENSGYGGTTKGGYENNGYGSHTGSIDFKNGGYTGSTDHSKGGYKNSGYGNTKGGYKNSGYGGTTKGGYENNGYGGHTGSVDFNNGGYTGSTDHSKGGYKNSGYGTIKDGYENSGYGNNKGGYENNGYGGSNGGFSGHTSQGSYGGNGGHTGSIDNNNGGFTGSTDHKNGDYDNHGGNTGDSGSEYYSPETDSLYRSYYQKNTYNNKNKVIQAAVRSKHYLRYVDVDVKNYRQTPQIVEIDTNSIPLILHFKSASSKIRVQQSHTGYKAGNVHETKSEDEPQHLRHEVTKPIIQEVREIVMPYRRVIQEIQPVVEEIQTIIARKGKDTDLQQHDGNRGDNRRSIGGVVGSVGTKNNKSDVGFDNGTGSGGISGNVDSAIDAVKRSTSQFNDSKFSSGY